MLWCFKRIRAVQCQHVNLKKILFLSLSKTVQKFTCSQMAHRWNTGSAENLELGSVQRLSLTLPYSWQSAGEWKDIMN